MQADNSIMYLLTLMYCNLYFYKNAVTLEVFTSYIRWQQRWLVLQARSLLSEDGYYMVLWINIITLYYHWECKQLLCYSHLLFGLELGLTFRWRCWKEAHQVKTFTHITHKMRLSWTSVQIKPLLKTSALVSAYAIRLGSCFSCNYVWIVFHLSVK